MKNCEQCIVRRLNSLKHLSKEGRLIAFDQDEHALENTLEDNRLTLVHHNFKYLSQFLNYHKASPVDGILADLGISSAQINEADRGFAHKYNAQLDMRMSKGIKLSAKDIINTYDTQSLIDVFRNYGEVKSAFNHKISVDFLLVAITVVLDFITKKYMEGSKKS